MWSLMVMLIDHQNAYDWEVVVRCRTAVGDSITWFIYLIVTWILWHLDISINNSYVWSCTSSLPYVFSAGCLLYIYLAYTIFALSRNILWLVRWCLPLFFVMLPILCFFFFTVCYGEWLISYLHSIHLCYLHVKI